MDTINRECAESLKACVFNLYRALFMIRSASRQAGKDMEVFRFSTKVADALDSAMRFLLERNWEACQDVELLDGGCRVEDVFMEMEKRGYFSTLSFIEIRVNALAVFGTLLINLFLLEVGRGAIPFECSQDGDEPSIEDLQEFIKSITREAIRGVRETPKKEIVTAGYVIQPTTPTACH